MQIELLNSNREILLSDCDLGINGDVKLPINDLCIALTNRCNLHCIMCPFCLPEYQNKTYNNEPPFVTTLDEYKKILSKESVEALTCAGNNNKAERAPVNIHFTHGESLLNPHIAEIAKYTKEIIPESIIRLSSNGTIGPNSILGADLLIHNIDHFCFSIDGCTQETFEAIRKPAKFEQVMKNLKAWSAVAKDAGKKNIFRFTVALSAMNIQELSGLVELAAHLGGYYAVVVQPLIVDDNHQTLESYKLEHIDKDFALQKLGEAQKVALELGISLYLDPSIMKIYEKEGTCSENPYEPGLISPYCNYFAKGFLEVDNNGNLKELCCNMSPEDNKYLIKKYGIASEKTVFELYNSAGFWALRKDLLEGKLRPYCKDCVYCTGSYLQLSQKATVSLYETPEVKDQHIIYLRNKLRSYDIVSHKQEGTIKEQQGRILVLNQELERRDATIKEQQGRILALNQELEHRDAMISTLNCETKEQKMLIGHLGSRLKQYNLETENLKMSLATVTKENDNNEKTIDAMLHSTSWKITKPIRLIGDFLRKLFRSCKC